ncbi:MAG: 3'(2'),5'-bisphosphate nucleotidase CysQ [Robiginitomaculum sp.]|nr:MAG: 3'(2'),5'-bisphosphate nucleotidase CysQ [Robiginitomaculum sp.]
MSTNDLELLQSAAKQAGALSMQWFGRPAKVWDKGDNHPVTEADLAVDELLHKILREARPEYGWLSEETIDDQSRLNSKRVFVVDPIDGTRAFMQGKPHFCTSIAIVEDGRPIVGAVFNPAFDEMYLAAKGQGAKLNDKPIQASSRAALEDCSMLAPEGLFRHKGWAETWPQMQCATRNSMAYRMVLVAGGGWDATLTLKPKSDWDLAAADLIAGEAGAVVSDPMGQKFLYNLDTTTNSGVICAGKPIHALIRRRIEQSQKETDHHEPKE